MISINQIIEKNFLFGAVNINKPHQITSHDVVDKLRRLFLIKQIGHSGTLDPLATGVLPIFIGKSTRIIEYLNTAKTYRAEVLLGVETDTCDMEGKIIAQKPVTLDLERINIILKEFKGEISQIPPMYSAVHYQGKRLYEYARNNIEIQDIPKRRVVIDRIEIISTAIIEHNPIINMKIECSGGTYIRSIARDIGEKLGYGACLKGLTRIRSGNFRIENSLSIEEVSEYYKAGQFDKFLVNPLNILNFKVINIDNTSIDKIQKGQSIKCDESFNDNMVQLVFENLLVGIGKAEKDRIKPVKIFV